MKRLRLLFLLVTAALNLPANANLELTAEERRWLQQHPVIRLGVDDSYPPYSFFDRGGHFRGAAAEFLRLLEQRLKIRFEPVKGLKWPDILEAAKSKRLDVIATVVKLPARESYLAFTRIYLPTPLVVMSRQELPQLKGPQELENLSVLLVRGYSSSQQALQRFPGLSPVWVDTPLEGLRSVAAAEGDAYIGVLGVNTWLCQHHGISNLKVNTAFDMLSNGQRLGVRKDWPLFARILDKALEDLSAAERNRIFRHWIPADAETIPVLGTGLTLADLEWFRNQSPLRMGIISNASPFIFVNDEGRPDGLAEEILLWIQDHTQAFFDFHASARQNRLLQQLRQGQVDIATIAAINDQAPPGIRLSPPFLRSNLMIFAKGKHRFSGAVTELDQLKIAAYSHGPGYDYLQTIHGITVLGKDNLSEVFQAVSRGEADAAVMEATLGLREREVSGYPDVEPQAPLQGAYISLHLGVREDRPRLSRLLDQLILAISPREHALILSHWLGSPIAGIPLRTLLKWVTAAAIILVCLALLILLWNRLIQRELERRQSKERALLAKARERQQLLEAVFHSIPDLFFRVSLDGTILDHHANDASELYVPPQQFLGKKMQEVLPGNLAKVIEKILQQLQQSPVPVTYEYRLPVPKGERFFEAKFNRLEGIDQAVILIRDTTARRQAEEALREARDKLEQRVAERTEELTAANRELESFSYAVSHDLRAPLRAIRGFCQALREDFGPQLPKAALEYIDEIASGSERMGELIEGLLALSRTAHTGLEREPVRLDLLARELFEQLAANEPERNVTLEIPESLEVEADLRLIRTLLQNLLENAWKFTRNRPAARITFYAMEKEGEQIFCLEDNGAGFDMTLDDRLFQPFQRLHHPREFPGVGIGLATVWRIVKRHGGWVKGEGKKNQGARFCFTLTPKRSQKSQTTH